MNISVIITCYNYGRFLERSIRSVLEQNINRSNFEIIVINDNSNDETENIMELYSDDIVSIHNKTQLGISASRNKGIKKAKGRYILNLDSDDYLDKNILFVLSLYLNTNPNFGAVSCDYFLVNRLEEHLERKSGKNDPIACGIMFRKDLLIKTGLYDENIKIWEEKDLRKRFLKKYRIVNIEIPFYRYRKHEESHTSKE